MHPAVYYLASMPDVFPPKPAHHGTRHHKRRSRAEHLKEAKEYSSVLRADAAPSSAFAAYRPAPDVTFDVQHDDEPVLLLLRQHPIVTIPGILITLLLAIGPFVLLPYFPILSFLPDNFRFIAVLGWYTMVFGYAFEQFLVWFFNIYIITDERIIDVDFYNLLFKKISEAQIENIEDITASNSGLLQSIIDYGGVRIQTAAEIPQLEFENVPHPDRVSKFLSEMIVQEQQEQLEGRVR